MKLLLVSVTAVLLCITCAGSVAAGVAPCAPRLVAAEPAQDVPASPVSTLVPPVARQGSIEDESAVASRVCQAIRAILPDSRLGFEVFDRVSGAVLASQGADQRFAAMSVVKLLIALDLLAGDDGISPDPATRQDLHQMLARSDDQIADRLWTEGGGGDIVTRVADQLGLTGTEPPEDPGQWGDTQITPADMVTVYRYLAEQLPTSGRDLVLGALEDAPRIAADGFDQYFGIPDGLPNADWAIKQGWGTSGSHAVMNSTGLVGTDLRYVVVVLVSAPASSYSAVPAAVNAGTAALAGLVTPGTS